MKSKDLLSLPIGTTVYVAGAGHVSTRTKELFNNLSRFVDVEGRVCSWPPPAQTRLTRWEANSLARLQIAKLRAVLDAREAKLR